MDSETQILLKEAIQAINSPDWWTIGITVVNALIMIWLGYNQYLLQKRQTDAQEYQIYRSLYILLSKIHTEINNHLKLLCNSCHEDYLKLDKDRLKRKLSDIQEIKKLLAEKYIDCELKFSKDIIDLAKYDIALSMMMESLNFFVKAIDEDAVILGKGSVIFKCEIGKEDFAYAIHISNSFKNKYLSGFAYNSFLEFIELKETLLKNNFLDIIPKKCKLIL